MNRELLSKALCEIDESFISPKPAVLCPRLHPAPREGSYL